MTHPAISDDIALRIALAARALPDMGAARLIRVTEDAIGLPPTAEKLGRLKAEELESALGGEFAHVEAAALRDAIGILKGETEGDPDPPPPVEPYAEGDMPESIRAACASNRGEELDGHFGSAKRFLVYQVSARESRLIEVRIPDDPEADDKIAYRAALISDCHVLYVASIGGPAAAKVIKADVHPIRDTRGGPAGKRIQALQQALADQPPPWLAKGMGRAPAQRVRFEYGEWEE